MRRQNSLVGEIDAKLKSRTGPWYAFPVKPNAITAKYDPTRRYYSMGGSYPMREPKDQNGVAWIYRKEIDGFSYHPVSIAQYGLGQFSNYVGTQKKVFLEEARLQADYFLRSIDRSTGEYKYDFDYKHPFHEVLEAGWASAMAQGLAISLLVRFYDQTGDEEYLETCRLAMKPLMVPVKDGGLLADFFGHPFYEEYPTESPSFTLNGFMFTLIGLLDLWIVAKDQTAKRLFDEGMNTLIFALPFYDANGISMYWLSHLAGIEVPVRVDPQYHMTHIRQLQTINQFAQSSLIDYYIRAWSEYVIGDMT